MEIISVEAKIGAFATINKIVPFHPGIAGNPCEPGGCPMNEMTMWTLNKCLGWSP